MAIDSRTPTVIAFAGPGSNSGKTTVACAVIAALRKRMSVAALKVATATPEHHCARTGLACSCLQFEGTMRLLKEDCYPDRPGKDTYRLRDAGASPVWWLQTTADVAIEAVRTAIVAFPPVDVLVVEGAGAIRAGLADFSVVLGPAAGREPKAGWAELLPRADALLLPPGAVRPRELRAAAAVLHVTPDDVSTAVSWVTATLATV